MEALIRSVRSRARIIIILSIVILLVAIGGLIASAIAASKNHDNLCCDIFDDGRGEAMTTATNMALALSQLLITPVISKDVFTNYFAPNAVFSTIMGNTVGPSNIDTLLQNYVNNPYETDVSIEIKNMFWDYKESTLTVEETRQARTTATKQMWNGAFVITVYPVNTTYMMDNIIIITFDCHGRIVRYRQSSCAIQRVSTYTDDYPNGCSPCDSKSKHDGGGHHHPHPHHPPHTKAPPTKAPTTIQVLFPETIIKPAKIIKTTPGRPVDSETSIKSDPTIVANGHKLENEVNPHRRMI